MITHLLPSRIRNLIIGSSVAVLLAVPACSAQYGIGVRCSEELKDCEIYTGIRDGSTIPVDKPQE